VLALIAITLSAVIALSPCRPVVRLLGFLYRLPLFIPFIVVAQMMRTFLAKNGLMNNALVAADLVRPLETSPGWDGRDCHYLCLEATGLCHAVDLRSDGGAGAVADPRRT
jgi:hypothetical protein